MDKKEIERISQLARKEKAVGLSPDEKEEQKTLRERYIKAIRNNLECQLQGIKPPKKQ